MYISIVLPIHNEEKNIAPLYAELKKVLDGLNKEYEIVCVDDGSGDGGMTVLKEIADKDKSVRVISFSANFGQTAALSAGIGASTGEIIIPMDADLQNDPNDITKFLEKINEGYGVVSGWRRKRSDRFISRRLPSIIANWIIRKITGVKIHDCGCSIKAYRREIIRDVHLYGEMHRFIAAYAAWQGGKVAEIEVNHRPRANGETNYGISRTFRVILDLIVVQFLSKYMNRPIHFFGGIGFLSLFLGFVTGITAIFLRLFGKIHLIQTPLPIISTFFVMVGVQLVVMGVIAEMIMRTYYESQHKEPYVIKEKINL